MSTRLIILAVIAAILALRFATTMSDPPKAETQEEASIYDGDGTHSLEDIRVMQKDLWTRGDLPGKKPGVAAEPQVRVEVDTSGGKNRFYLYISESHGFYMDTITIDVWYTGENNEYNDDNSPLTVTQRIMNKYLKANDTLVDCMEIVPTELDRIGGDIGDTQNWDAEVVSWMDNRVRESNPDPLPLIYESDRCD